MVQWKLGKSQFKGDASLCYQEITSLGDTFTPEDIVELAMDENTELHKCFIWDDAEAARRYRVVQAKEMIRSIVIIPDKKENEEQKPVVRLLVSKNEYNTTYEPISVTIRQEASYEKLLKEALRELESFRKKYQILKELDVLFEDIDKLIA